MRRLACRCVMLGFLAGAAGAAVGQKTPAPLVELEPLPPLILEGLEPVVAEQLRGLARAVGEHVGEPAPGAAEDWGTLGGALLAYELLDPALASLRNAGRLAPGDPRWPHLVGITLERRGDQSAAVRRFEAAARLAPEAIGPICRLAQGLVALGHFESAAVVIDTVLAGQPDCAAAWAAKGELALAQGDGASALDALDRAIATAPEATRLHHPRGLALRLLGRTEEARLALNRAGTVGVACPDPWWEWVRTLVGGARLALVRGRQALAAQRPADALAAFDQALAADPDSSPSAIGRAAALVALDRVDEAVAVLVALVTRYPNNAEAWYNLGILAGRQGQIDSSVGALRRAVTLRPDDLEARLRLAEALRAGAASEEAMLELGLAELAEPREPAPALLASRWLAEDGHWDAAIGRLERAIGRGASTPTVEVSLARLLAMHPDPTRRDPARAEPLVRAAIGILPDEVVRESLMMVLQAAGRCAEAAEQATLLRGPEVGEQVRAQCELTADSAKP